MRVTMYLEDHKGLFQLQELFDVIDTNNDGFVDVLEFASCLRQMGTRSVSPFF